jgi:hypothetical protein
MTRLMILATFVVALILYGSQLASSGTTRPDPALAQAPATGSSLADFDFAKGTAYPARAGVRIGDLEVPVGATEAHVPITLDRPTPNTVAARVTTRNGSGGRYG